MQMSDFNCTKFDFGSGSAPDPHWGSLQRSHRLPSWICGTASRQGEGLGWGRGGKGEAGESGGGGKGRAPKLLLNQGPSEPCYATAITTTTL